jgi:hypothetical protein
VTRIGTATGEGGQWPLFSQPGILLRRGLAPNAPL